MTKLKEEDMNNEELRKSGYTYIGHCVLIQSERIDHFLGMKTENIFCGFRYGFNH